MNPIPTGNETDVVTAYYQYLYTLYYHDIPLDRATGIYWAMQAEVWAWLITLLIFFYFFTYMLTFTHYPHGALYQATSFAGSLYERNGRVSIFTWSIIFGLLLSGVYIGIRYIMYGFIY